jgi:hypothetical protein
LGRRDLYCVAILLALPTVIFSDVIFGGASLAYRDLAQYHFPLTRIVRDAMLSGEFPQWNRFLAAGQPLAANPAYLLFYPGQWPILIGSHRVGFMLHIVLHLYVAAIGMFLLLRGMHLSRAAATFCAMSYSCGGLFLGAMSLLPIPFVWALAPLVGWRILRYVEEPTSKRFALAALSAGVQLLVLEPMSLAQVWFLYGAGVVLLAVKTNLPRKRVAMMFGAVAITAFLTAAVQAIPAVDHVRDSARARGFSFATVGDFSMPPIRPLEVMMPAVYHTALRGRPGAWARGTFELNGVRPYYDSIYPGAAVAALALGGLLTRAPGALTTALVVLASFILALGKTTPLLRVLYDAGVARVLRYPEKFVFMGVATLIVFAAVILDRLLKGDERARRAALSGAAVLAAIRAVPVIWSLLPDYAGSFTRYWRLRPEQASLAAAAQSAWMTALIISVLLLLTLVVRRRLRQPIFLALFFLIVAVDVTTHAYGIVPRVPSLFYSPPPVAAAIASDGRDAAVFHRGRWTPENADRLRYKARSASWLARNALEPFTPASWALRSVLELDYDETFLLSTHDALDAMMSLGNSGFARWWEPFAILSSAGYIVDYRSFDAATSEAAGNLIAERAADVLRVPAQPRYFIARRTVRAVSTEQTLAYLRANPRPYLTAITPFASPPSQDGRVTRFAEGPNESTIDVEATGPSLLVMTVTRHKYWRAWIDGKAAQLLPVNIAYQGVLVPGGRHRVTMRYSNPVVMWSGLVSLITLLTLTTILIRPRPRPRSGS